MQRALSIAFASGNLSARNLTRARAGSRRSIRPSRLNRTQIGFSHGENVFGWRFYPRFQTPPTESNLTVFFRDQPGRAEPRGDPAPAAARAGRECVAIVMMPSFVPYLTCDTVGNWFKLTNPKCKKLTSTQTLKLSRAIKSIQNCVHSVHDSDCYRDGDLMRLVRKAEQMEARMPLQTLQAQVPYENTVGGFEMFNTGITDLAPELLGWYGAPGIDLEKGNVLFLIGDNFSVLQTKVIVGNRDCGFTLLSRQVMQILIPGRRRVDGQVEVHLATLSRRLAHADDSGAEEGCGAPAATVEGYSISPTKLTAAYKVVPVCDGKYSIVFESLQPGNQSLERNGRTARQRAGRG
jgi:hypothetical protein